MNSLVRYDDSEDEDDTVLTPPPVRTAIVPEKSQPVLIKPSFSSLPPPSKAKQKNKPLIPIDDAILPRSPTLEQTNTDAALEQTNTDAALKQINTDAADDTYSENDGTQILSPPAILMGDDQGPTPFPPITNSYHIPEVILNGRIIKPPPGLIPPPTLKTSVNFGSDGMNGAGDMQAPDRSFALDMRKGHFVDISMDDLRRQEWSRDPMIMNRGPGSESVIAAGLWSANQATIPSVAPAMQGSKRHHISSMSSNAAAMEAHIRQQSAQGTERRKLAKAKYGW